MPVNWRGHNGRSPRSRWAARHNVRAVGTRSPSLASRGLMLGAPRLNMLPFPRPQGRGRGAGRSGALPAPRLHSLLLSLLPPPQRLRCWLAEDRSVDRERALECTSAAASRGLDTLPSRDLLPSGEGERRKQTQPPPSAQVEEGLSLSDLLAYVASPQVVTWDI